MSEAEVVKQLLVRGIALNDWILELPQRVDNGIPEWNHVVLEISTYDKITVRTAEKSEYLYLVQEYEQGLLKISDYMKRRNVINAIKGSILNDRLKYA